MRCYDFVPGLLPLFIIDVLFRFYSTAVCYSLLLKYREALRARKRQKLEDIANSSNPDLFPPPNTSTMANNDGVLKILDNFLFFVKLEVAAYVYAVVNILGSVAFMLYLVVYLPMMGGKGGKGQELKILDLIIYVIFFVVNFGMTLSLLVGIKTVSGAHCQIQCFRAIQGQNVRGQNVRGQNVQGQLVATFFKNFQKSIFSFFFSANPRSWFPF